MTHDFDEISIYNTVINGSLIQYQCFIQFEYCLGPFRDPNLFSHLIDVPAKKIMETVTNF
jgi:hypothetical protein